MTDYFYETLCEKERQIKEDLFSPKKITTPKHIVWIPFSFRPNHGKMFDHNQTKAMWSIPIRRRNWEMVEKIEVDHLTLQEVANIFYTSRQRVHQIYKSETGHGIKGYC